MVDPIWTEGWKCSLCQTIHEIQKDATWCCYKKALGISTDTTECLTCEGDGKDKTQMVECDDCGGTGFVHWCDKSYGNSGDCEDCDGKGVINPSCEPCKGTGKILKPHDDKLCKHWRTDLFAHQIKSCHRDGSNGFRECKGLLGGCINPKYMIEPQGESD